MASPMFNNFYSNNNTLEICVILFDKCNLHCKFCFENHTNLISCEEILNIGDSLLQQLEPTLSKRPGITNLTFRFWGGELFMDGIPDSYLDTYQQLLDKIRVWCVSHKYTYDFCFSSNLVFTKRDRILNFLQLQAKDTYLATSYDPVARFHSPEVENIWWENLKIFNPKVISITLTRPAIEKYLSTDILQRLSSWELYPEYYIYNKDWEQYAPTGIDVFEFYKFCYLNNITNIPEINNIIDSYQHYNGRYCYCLNSCSFINGKLVFSCILRSGTLSMLSDYGMTLEECYDNDNCTEKQFNIATSRLKCFQCQYYDFCRLPCMASRLHKATKNITCQLKLFYDWIKDYKNVN